MIEKEYSQLSPVELNWQLHAIYEQLPEHVLVESDFSDEEEPEKKGLDWVLNTYTKRENSEHKEALLTKLNDLLGFSPTTTVFKQFVLELFVECYDTGILKNGEKQLPARYSFGWLTDPDNIESGGIFEKGRAIELERKAYHTQLQQYLTDRKVFESLAKSPEEEIFPQLVESLRQWRQQFVDLYGNEP